MFSIVRWRDETVRSWIAVEPVAALGPTDPAIPLVAVIASSVPALGYCAPVVGPERPALEATLAVWRLADGGGAADRLALERVVPSVATILGGLFAPPGTGSRTTRVVSDGWPPGRYVFDVDGHWFGAEIRLIPSVGDGSPPPPDP